MAFGLRGRGDTDYRGRWEPRSAERSLSRAYRIGGTGPL